MFSQVLERIKHWPQRPPSSGGKATPFSKSFMQFNTLKDFRRVFACGACVAGAVGMRWFVSYFYVMDDEMNLIRDRLNEVKLQLVAVESESHSTRIQLEELQRVVANLKSGSNVSFSQTGSAKAAAALVNAISPGTKPSETERTTIQTSDDEQCNADY